MPDQICFERITRLEERCKDMHRENSDHRERTEAYMQDIQLGLREIRAQQNKQKGFYSGLVFGAGVIFSVIGFLAEKLLK